MYEQERLTFEMKECTFAPDLRLTSARNKSASSSNNPHDRLHGDAVRQQDRLRTKQILRNSEAFEDCTFSPRINNVGITPRTKDEPVHFEKLHKTHDKILRDRRRKEHEQYEQVTEG